MTPERYGRVTELFQAASRLNPENRPAFLAQACAGDEELRRELEHMLQVDAQASGFLAKPLGDVAADVLRESTKTFSPGLQLGAYRVVSLLGTGGMGEVYRAHDSKLGRDVALKTLPSAFADHPDRLARFRREARTLASLNHPNIAAIYGLEESEVATCLVLELVEGETLRGPLPLEKALDYGRQVSEALEAAHSKGIIHRDLKPANVKVTPQGRVKVLDFGLAKAVWGTDENQDPSRQATATILESVPGQIAGTPPYMSPEQARGRDVNQRTDIWAFGCLLYELLSGKQAFRRETVQDTLAAILQGEPDWAALPAKTPAKVRELLHRCLEKDITRRLKDIVDARLAIEAAQRKNKRWPVAAAVVAVVAAGSALWLRGPFPGETPHAEFMRLTSQPGVEWFPSLSPDGKWIVYGGNARGARHIFLQSVSGQNLVDLTSDSNADDDQPVFSPDGEHVAFRSDRDGGGIFVMGRTGEAVRRVTRAGFNPAWSPDGAKLAFTTEKIELYPQNFGGRNELWTVALDSGETKLLWEEDAGLPSWSPHNQRIAFAHQLGNPAQGDIWTIPAIGGRPTPVTNDAARDWNPVWSPDGKYLYFASDRGGSMNLWRVRVDEASGKSLAGPEPITTPAGYFAHPSISADGKHIAFASVVITANIQQIALDASASVKGDPVWVTTGSRIWSSPDPSPDGQWVVFYSLTQPEGKLYLSHPDGTGLHQLTGDMAIDRLPRWSPDGNWISFFSNRSGDLELWKIRPDGSGLQQLTEGGAGFPGWSPDGSRMATVHGIEGMGDHASLWVFDPNRPWKRQTHEVLPPHDWSPLPFLAPSWSPDGERLAGTLGTASGIAIYTFRTREYERLADFGQSPAWFPDSRRLLFVANGNEFYVMDAHSRQIRRVLSSGRDVIGPPRLTRDGEKVYFSRRITESDLWLMTLK
jgi:eukaryotic-like serine/threonine-protein kinase